MRTFFLLLLAISFYACGDADQAVVDDTTTEVADVANESVERATTAPGEATAFLQTTIDAVQNVGGDITALPTEAAANNINGWITKLSDVDGSDEVVDGLAQLKKALMQAEIDGGEVSGILASLADETRELEGQAPGLSTLADVLQAGSDKLAGK